MQLTFPAFVAAAALLLAGVVMIPCQAQPAGAASAPVAAASAASRPASAKHPASATKTAASAKRSPTKPLWTELTPAQQQALKPLAGTWDTVSEAQKRKWLALSQNYPRMSGAEQEKLHSRMSEWVALSPQQRTTARLNFGQTQQISPDDKKAKWEAYQALSPEEKSKLAAKASKPPPTAAAVKPSSPEKTTALSPPRPKARVPGIAGADQVDRNTLLPPSSPAQTTN
jgi:hypothetical protein